MNQSTHEERRWIAADDADALCESARRRILATADRAIAARGAFLIVLAGGETPRGVYRRLCDAGTDWSRWHVYFGDERCLAETDPARNSRMALDAWLVHVPIPEGQIHTIPAELGATAGAARYAATLRNTGDFDLVLLGLGEDAHTASLFPGHDWGVEPRAPDVLAVNDAPKPPPHRVTLSAARLSRAREVLFLVAGEAKREAVVRLRAHERLPAAAIKPAGGVDVLVEAALLTPKR